MEENAASTFGDLLKGFRRRRNITQQELATRIGTHRNTIGTWERGDFLPESKTLVLELARQLHMDEQDTRRLLEASLTALSPYWHLPYMRNPFFTGRENVLDRLHEALKHEQRAVLSQSYALSGLGGIGKTQTAIEYAYRYANAYSAVFWISAETPETIVSSMVAIADVLNLPEKQEEEQNLVVSAALRWLTNHHDWLLIFDNVEDIELIKDVLPSVRGGYLLFTSRRQALGLSAQTLKLEPMTPEEGMHFLLYRVGRLTPTMPLGQADPAEAAQAEAIVTSMDGLPLALDQAGAYIEATQCGLDQYLQHFRSSPLRLLDEHSSHAEHPLSVTRTFLLALERVQKKNTLASEILTACAFLAPEAIPENFFIESADLLGPACTSLVTDPLQFDAAIRELLVYSLLQRHPATHTVTIHRLVQVVLKENLPEAVQRTWVAQVQRAMIRLFPQEEHAQADYWHACERLLPHALTCVTLGMRWEEGATERIVLMNAIATYLWHRGRSSEGEQLCLQALRLGEHMLGPEHLQVADTLQILANLSKTRGEIAKAETLYIRTLAIRERALGSEHLQVAETLHTLANLYSWQSKYTEAESLYRRTLAIREHGLGPKHPLVASSLNGLATLSLWQGKYQQAALLDEQALSIREALLGPEHTLVAGSCNNLADIYCEQGMYEQAERLYQRAFSIWEGVLGAMNNDVGFALQGLADLYCEQEKYEQAEALYQRALRIWEHNLGSEHQLAAYAFQGLATLSTKQGKYEQAELLYERALHIRERTWGPEHPDVASSLVGQAILYREQGKYEQADRLLQRALHIQEQTLAPEHPTLAETFHHLAFLRQMQHRTSEACSLYEQALVIREQALGPEHPKTCATRTAYTLLLNELGHTDYAECHGTSFFPSKEKEAEVSNGEALSVEHQRPLPACPSCQRTTAVVRKGVNPTGSRRFWCRVCQHYFTPDAKQRGNAALKAQALALAQEGHSARVIAQQLNLHHSTVSLWIKGDQQQ